MSIQNKLHGNPKNRNRSIKIFLIIYTSFIKINDIIEKSNSTPAVDK